MNKIGQISSNSEGNYFPEDYPTEKEFLDEWETLKEMGRDSWREVEIERNRHH